MNGGLLRVVVVRGEKQCIAQCLEHDIAAQGNTVDLALERVRYSIETEIRLATERGEYPFAKIPRAPDKFWKMYDRATVHVDEAAVEKYGSYGS